MVTPVSFFSRTTRACVWLLLWCGVLGFFTARVLAGEISATLQAESVPAATGTRLTLKISGSDIGDITLPRSPGPDHSTKRHPAEFPAHEWPGEPQCGLFLCGRLHEAGGLHHSGIHRHRGREALKTKPLKLKVLPPAARLLLARPRGTPAPVLPREMIRKERALRVAYHPAALEGRKYAWVGEIVPVTIKVWVPQGARIERVAKIQPQSPAFTLSEPLGDALPKAGAAGREKLHSTDLLRRAFRYQSGNLPAGSHA